MGPLSTPVAVDAVRHSEQVRQSSWGWLWARLCTRKGPADRFGWWCSAFRWRIVSTRAVSQVPGLGRVGCLLQTTHETSASKEDELRMSRSGNTTLGLHESRSHHSGRSARTDHTAAAGLHGTHHVAESPGRVGSGVHPDVLCGLHSSARGVGVAGCGRPQGSLHCLWLSPVVALR